MHIMLLSLGVSYNPPPHVTQNKRVHSQQKKKEKKSTPKENKDESSIVAD